MGIRPTFAVFCVVCSPACPSASSGPATIATAITVAPAAMTAVVAAVRDELAPPWSLTASDGSGLALVRVDARAVAEGPLAFTELHLDFRNDEDRVREGTFQIALPARAHVARFAMENAGGWMEAEVVPRLVARRAYDDFLHRRQDPALLEQAPGNQFTAKVFPIAARSVKHLVISYSQELPELRYALPLRGLPSTERVDVELAITGDGARPPRRLAERDWRPDRDFEADLPAGAAAVGAGGLVAARIQLPGEAGRDAPRGIALLVDTSASRSLGFDGYLASVRRLVGELRATWGDALPLAVIAFDQDAELVFDGPAAELGEPGVRQLAGRGAAGASDLGQALAWIADHRGTAKPRVVVITDGVITAGAEGRALQAEVQRLSACGVERLDVVLAGGLRDERTAALLVRGGLPRAGAVLDLARDRVAAALGDAVSTDVPIAVAGAAWVYPRVVDSARPGAPVMVFARLAAPAPFIDVAAGGASARLPVRPAAAPLVERAVAGAELAELTARLATATGDPAAALRAAIAKRSVAARVLSSETSMLVLESDADYARYGIERRALAGVLVVGPRGVEQVDRHDLAPIPARPAGSKPPPARDDEPELATTGAHGPPPPRPAPAQASDAGADRDGDGIPDAVDGCPGEPERRTGAGAGARDDDDDGDGCPVRGRVIVTSAEIMVLDNVYFEPDRAVIGRGSLPVLDAVAATLLHNPDIAAVEVQGHTDERGDEASNLALSTRRAEAVTRYLVDHGVAAQRLTAQGYAGIQPLDRRHTAAAWASNRRVGFLIVRRANDLTHDATRDATHNGPPTAPAGTAAPAPRPTPAPPAKPPAPPAAVTGELAAIQAALRARELDAALARARAWHAREPGDVLALIGLGEALEARRADATAARIYGSIIDLYPGRADLRRFAGERLSRLANARQLAVDTFRRAVADRPDHLTGHRLLAYALVRAGRPADGFAAILAGLDQTYRDDSYAGGRRVLGDDAAMIGAVYAAAAPDRRAEIAAALRPHHLELATRPSTRFVLYWETDGNDVDLHVRDARGGHAFFSQPRLASGGELYADVTTGYGPECFAIPGMPAAGPYALSLDYYAQGPMGYGMGLVEIQRFDPARGLAFDDRPYVIMNNHAQLELGTAGEAATAAASRSRAP